MTKLREVKQEIPVSMTVTLLFPVKLTVTIAFLGRHGMLIEGENGPI